MKRPNRARLSAVVLTFAAVAAACSGSADTGESSATSASDPLPTATFVTFDGEDVALASYTGRPLVVNFWASWCPSCVAEMSSAFRPAQQQLGDEVTFLGINIQDERPKALDLVAETGALFDLAEDETGELYTELGGLGMPFTVFVSAAGEVIERHNGPLTEQQLVDRINEFLLS